jgi:hypothetical protein
MSSEELMRNIFFCSAALISAMYVSDEHLTRPQYPISPPIHNPAESFCFRLAVSSNVGALREQRPAFSIPYIGEASYWVSVPQPSILLKMEIVTFQE